MKKILILFLSLLLITCQTEEVLQTTSKVEVSKSSPAIRGKLRTRTIQFINPDSTNSLIGAPAPCMIDHQYYDECPYDLGGGSWGGTGAGPGGTVPDPENMLPDFNPLSGSIQVTPNPAEIGSLISFSATIANQGGIFFPEGSLRSIAGYEDLGIGVHVHVHLLSSQHPLISEENMVFIGVLDPGHQTTPQDYLIDGAFPLLSSIAIPGENHQLAIVVDPGHYVPEFPDTGGDSNNTSYDTNVLLVNGSKPDLVALSQASDITLSPNPIASGGMLSIGCKVKNIGGKLIGPASFKVKYTATPAGGDELINPTTLGTVTHTVVNGQPLGTNATTPILSGTFALNLFPGTYTVKAEVDSDHQITETNSTGEGNNLIIMGTLHVGPTGTAPDLIDAGAVRAFTPAEVDPGKPLSIEMHVKNIGTLAAGAFTIRFYISTDAIIKTSDVFVGAFQVDGAPMVPGETRDIIVGGQVPANAEPGYYHVGWIIDTEGGPKGQVVESNENNNKAVATELLLVNGPDLAGGSTFFSGQYQAKAVPGEPIEIDINIENKGPIAANAPLKAITFYLSTDASLEVETDRKIHTTNLNGYGSSLLYTLIPPFTTATKKYLVPIPDDIAPGGYSHLFYYIDPPEPSHPRGDELETDETNNTGYVGLINIVSACDLINEVTVQEMFSDAVLANGGSFCKFSSTDHTPVWLSTNAFATDHDYFQQKKIELNGKFCSEAFSDAYGYSKFQLMLLLPELKDACPSGSIDFHYSNLPSDMKDKFDDYARRFMASLSAAQAGCGPTNGHLEPVIKKRVYCSCDNTDYLNWSHAGPQVGAADCGTP